MAFKTILTVVGPDFGDADLERAADLCLRTNAHLAVLALSVAAPMPVADFSTFVSDVWITERQQDLATLQARVAAIDGRLAAQGLSCDVVSDYPEAHAAPEVVGRRARYADLTLVGPDMLARDDMRNIVVEGALFSSGKPLLLVPAGATATLAPQRVMIAWDARIEASNAVARALDLLGMAEEVRIVLVDPNATEAGAEPGADIASYLARHGAKVSVDRLPSQGMGVAEVLRRHAVDTAADMLVMGGFGHSRLQERIFGGVTKTMIASPPLPIFMAR